MAGASHSLRVRCRALHPDLPLRGGVAANLLFFLELHRNDQAVARSSLMLAPILTPS